MENITKISEADFVKEVKAITELFNSASIESSGGQKAVEEMVTRSRALLEAQPSSAEPQFMLGLLAFKLGDEGKAIELIETAHKINPEVREYAETLSVICASVGRLADAMYYAKIVPSLKSHKFLHAGLPSNLANLETALKAMGPSKHFAEASRQFNLADYPKTLKECAAELRINQKNYDAYILLAKTLLIVKSFSQAASALHAAIIIKPAANLPRALLSRALLNLGNFEEASVIAKKVLGSVKPSETEAYANAMEALLNCPGQPLAELKYLAEHFHNQFTKEHPKEEGDDLQKSKQDEINIGLISNAFFRNKNSTLFKSWLPPGPPLGTNLLGYQQSVASDNITTSAIKACHKWREIYDTDPFTIDITMKADELDILVDLSGLDDNPRMEIVGTNSSPNKVGTFCLSEPGFAPGITHILCDDILIKANDEVLLKNQKKILVNGSLFSRQPYFALEKDIPTPSKERDYVTFGGIIDLIRLSPECSSTWSEILHAVPNSKLLLCGSEQANHEIKSKVCQYFANEGLTERLMFPEPPPSEAEPPVELVEATIPNSHWQEIDIFLDTFPYNCTNELCEALWTGAPVISLSSDRRLGLLGASILTAAKRQNWIAKTKEDYSKLATELALNPDMLNKERLRLQKNISNTALFDGSGFSKELINALKKTIP